MCIVAAALFLVKLQASQVAGESESPNVSLTVPSGVPVRLYLTKRIPKRLDAPVEGKIMETVFAFDREVLPAGSAVADDPRAHRIAHPDTISGTAGQRLGAPGPIQ